MTRLFYLVAQFDGADLAKGSFVFDITIIDELT